MPEEPDECVDSAQHRVPPEQLRRYSTIRDAASEQDIARYVQIEADEIVQHVEKIKDEFISLTKYEIWDVITTENRWWVISNHTNLYSQKHFPSLDYTISFHIGLMQRMGERQASTTLAEPDPFGIVERHRDQIFDTLRRAVDPAQYQSVGLMARELLILISHIIRNHVEIDDNDEVPKSSDFLNWIDFLLNASCPGDKNKQLRQYMKALSKETWQLSNWLAHDRNANQSAAVIVVHACDTIIGHLVQIFYNSTDNIELCPNCSSRDIRTLYDHRLGQEGTYFKSCGKCSWSDHPTGEFDDEDGDERRPNEQARPLSARYDRRAKKIVVALDTGIDVAFRADDVQGLRGASPDDLAAVTISPLGLHWEKLDADLSIAGLLAGRLGSERWMAALIGARGGKARSAGKTEAARANGRKGGRPRKA